MAAPGESAPAHGYTAHLNENSLLWRLADYSDIIRRGNNHTVTVDEYIETPYDEFGIINRQELFRRILGSVASEYHWEGSFAGPHHLMWPRAAYNYPNITRKDTPLTTTFRGSPSLKVILPRELHDYLHRVTEPPTMPDLDVMRQYNLEQAQVSRLYTTVYHASYADTPLTEEEKELVRQQRLLDKLETMEDGQLGLMPSRELLANLPLADSRRILRHRALPIGISAHRACQQVFFDDDIAA